MSDVDRCVSRNNVDVFFQPFKRCANCFAMDKSFHAQKSVFPRPRILMKRFLFSRSSSQQELQPLDDVRAERAAIALSVALSWPPDRYTKQTRGRPSWQQLWERALQEHIMNHHPQGWWRPGEAIDRPLTHEELAIIKTPCAAPAAAPVEDGPSSTASKRRKIQIDPIARDWFLDMLGQWRRAAMGHAAVLVRGPASLPRDVRRDQPEHSLPLETEYGTSRDTRQENFAVTR